MTEAWDLHPLNRTAKVGTVIIDKAAGRVMQSGIDFAGLAFQRFLDTQDAQIAAKLVELGWTPPADHPHKPDSNATPRIFGKPYRPVLSLADLKPGTIVRGKFSGLTFVVTGNYGDHVTAVLSQDITNPPEWEIVDNA